MHIKSHTSRYATRAGTATLKAFAATTVLWSFMVGAAAASGAETPSGAFICFGDGFAFATEQVPGWLLDQEAGRPDGLCVVGYRKPANSDAPGAALFKESPVVMFALVSTRFREGHILTYDEIQSATADRFRESKPDLEIRDGDPIQVDGKKVIVRKYFPRPVAGQNATGLSWDSFAYIEEPMHFVTLVLSARSKEEHDRAYQDFRQYVRTYRMITKLSRH